MIYYKFHNYAYFGAYCPDEWGACIKPGLLEGYYKSKSNDDYVIYSVLIDTYVYKKTDKTTNPQTLMMKNIADKLLFRVR